MLLTRLSIAPAFLGGLFVAASLLSSPAFAAQEPAAAPSSPVQPDGRPTGRLEGVTPPIVFERERVRRTVPLEPAGIAERWDVLYSVPADSGDGPRTAYFDWDANYLYVAWESPSAEAVRIDLDAQDDGWLRGADNLSFQIQPAGDAAATLPVKALRYDAVQNRDRPVFAASPIPVSEIKATGGGTGRGTYAVLVAIPRTELVGLERKDGARFGLRILHGVAAAPVADNDASSAAGLVGQTMQRLTLAEAVPAARDGVTVTLQILGPRDVAAGESVRAVLDIKNDSRSEVPFSGLFIRGYGAAAPLVQSTAADAPQSLPPGKKVSRELRTTVEPVAALGALPLVGGVKVNGETVAALTSFEYVEPYGITLKSDARPIRLKPDGMPNGDAKRGVSVSVVSRVPARADAEIAISLPPGWLMEGGTTRRKLSLRGEGDIQAFAFKLVPPATALASGPQKVEVTAQIAGKTYTGTAIVLVEGANGESSSTTTPQPPPTENGEHAPQ